MPKFLIGPIFLYLFKNKIIYNFFVKFIVTKKGRTCWIRDLRSVSEIRDPGWKKSGSGPEHWPLHRFTWLVGWNWVTETAVACQVRIKWLHHSWIPHHSVYLYHGPNIYKDTKPETSSLLVFNRVYRLEMILVQSVMLVFSTLLVN